MLDRPDPYFSEGAGGTRLIYTQAYAVKFQPQNKVLANPYLTDSFLLFYLPTLLAGPELTIWSV